MKLSRKVKTLTATLAALELLTLGAKASAADAAQPEASLAVTEQKSASGSYKRFTPKSQKNEAPQPVFGPAPKAVDGVVSKILPVSVEARFFAPHYDMKVHTDKIYVGAGSNSVGLKDDLGFGNDNAPELIFRYKRLSIDYFHIHGTGSKNIDPRNSVTFNGGRYFGQVDSKSNFDYIKLDVTNPIVSVLGQGFDWSYGVTAMHWKGSVRGYDASKSAYSAESKDYWVPLPALGLGGHMTVDPAQTVRLYAKVSGLPAGGYGHYYDLEAGVKYQPIPLLAITAGYRRIEVEAKHDGDSGKIKMNGPFAGLSFSF